VLLCMRTNKRRMGKGSGNFRAYREIKTGVDNFPVPGHKL